MLRFSTGPAGGDDADHDDRRAGEYQHRAQNVPHPRVPVKAVLAVLLQRFLSIPLGGVCFFYPAAVAVSLFSSE